MSKKTTKYYLINKPYGVLSQFTSEGGNPGLGTLYQLSKDVYPVGRLDKDSEGLLLLTNDKTINHKLLDPKYEHERVYWVEVENRPDSKTLKKLSEGVEINLKGKIHKTKQCGVKILENLEMMEREPPVNRKKHPITCWLEIRLTEGKNRQVRRMTAKIGHPTLRLIRFAIENLELGKLEVSGIVEIPKSEVYDKLNLR